MKNLKIGKKLLVTFGVIIALFCVTVVLSVVSLTGSQSKFDSFYGAGYQITNNSMDMRRAIQAMAKYLGYAMMTTDETESQNYIQNAKDELDALRSGTAYLKENFQGDMSLVDNYDAVMKDVMDERDHVFELALQNKNQEASELYFNEVMPAFVQAQEYLMQINTVASQKADNNYQNAADQAGSTTILLVVISAVALGVTIFLATYITRSLTRPIQEIEAAADQMAAGNLNAEVSYTSKDELGGLSDSIRVLISNLRNMIGDVDFLLSEIAEGNFRVKSKNPAGYVGDFNGMLLSMRKLRNSLSDTLSQINQSADQVSAGSDQVSSGAQALSQGATEQASSVEELAATVNEISSQVNGNAQSARQGSELAKAAGDKMEEGNRQMQEMIQAMADISDKSGQIGKIIKTIEDIAFQTNILALNAAVEAARAGAAGKGFAVVADEVRTLASKSAEASKSTASLIEGSIQAVARGTKLADDTARTLTEVVESAKQVVETVDIISLASDQQAISINQVTQGIDQISSVVQTNSATAEESAAASEELSGQAQMLKNLVAKFKLLEEEHNNFSSPAAHIPPAEQNVQLATADGKY